MSIASPPGLIIRVLVEASRVWVDVLGRNPEKITLQTICNFKNVEYNVHEVLFMQSVIYDMLQEEKERNLKMQEAYQKEIEALRKGSIMTKCVSGHTYYYLRYRQGSKVKNDYIGKDKNLVEEVRREVERRKYLQGVLKRLRLEYRQIGKIVKE